MYSDFFLSDVEMQKLEAEINKHTCCDICFFSWKCTCGECDKLEIENLIDNVQYALSESSDSDTIDYNYETFNNDDNQAPDNLSDDDEFYDTLYIEAVIDKTL